MSDFRTRIGIKKLTGIRIIIHLATHKLRNRGVIVSRDGEWYRNYSYTRNYKITANDKDLKRKPLLFKMGWLT